MYIPAEKPIVIVSDIRRKTDIKYFREEKLNIKTIRIEASDEVRKERGWIFENGVDNVQSECDLDDFNHWDYQITNDGTQDIEQFLTELVNAVRAEISAIA